jgi:acetylornithine deacetylase
MSDTTETTIDLLGRLVGFPTVSADSNLALIEFIADYLAKFGIHADVAPNDDGTKADLFASLGPDVEGGIVLSGHTDVVPVADQTWTSDPFAMARQDGGVVGRGTTDMKGFIAAVLAHVPAWRELDLKVPFHFAFSYDEEIGCLGAPGLIRRLQDHVPTPYAAIIGEPTEMKVINAHKGIAAFTTTVTGRPGHSSNPPNGVNAVMAAAKCIAFLDELQAEYRAKSERGEASVLEQEFDPPYTTVNVGTIDGGSAVNIIAAKCSFVWECRGISGTDAAEIKRRFDAFAQSLVPAMQAVDPATGIETDVLCNTTGLVAEPGGSPAEALALALTGENRCQTVPYGTEAGLFQRAGIPAVVCGPGSVRQAHQPDEFIAVSELEACNAFLERLAQWAVDGGK